jgi:arylsulfatase A-like enzyme
MTEGRKRGGATSVRKPDAWLWVGRSTILFALVGLLLGMGEAARLYLSPRWPLLSPDVRYVIWFVAPLTDLCLAALMGLALGLVIAERHLLGIDRHLAKVTAILLGAAFTLCVGGLAGRLAPEAWKQGLQARNASLCWLLAFPGFLVICCFRRERILSLIQNGSPRHFRRATITLLTSAGMLLCGLTAYTLNRSGPPATVRASTDLTSDRPNIVLISLDTVRADHLSLYGYERPTVPNLERWARQGVVFDNAIAPSSWTLPSLASIMTGLLPHQHGAGWQSPVRGNPWTLARILHSKGYEAASFNANLFYGYAGWGLQPGFEVYNDDSFSVRHNLVSTLAGETLLQPSYSLWVQPDRLDRRSAQQVNQEVFSWFQHKPEHPFFLFLNYFDAHEPFVAPAPYDRRFGRASNELTGKSTKLMQEQEPSQILTDDEHESVIASYDNCVAYLDNELNTLLTFLSSQREWSNTVVIITADHGEAFGEHGAYGHGWNLYREVLHVPLVVLGPGVPTGVRIESLAATRKLFATVLDLTMGGEPFARHSLRAFWTRGQRSNSGRRALISELLSRTSSRESFVSVFSGQWHYLEDSAGHKELYDWTSDPGEKVNLAQRQPTIVKELASRLRASSAKSVRPWEAPEYLGALGLDPGWTAANAGGPSPGDPIGVCQKYFRQNAEHSPPREVPDEDLLRSIPYD